MNDITQWVYAVLWVQVGMSIIILISAGVGFLIDIFGKLNSYPKQIYANYQEYFTFETLQFISPQARKLYGKTMVKLLLLVYLFFTLIILIVVSMLALRVSNWNEPIIFNDLLLPLIIYLVSIVLYLVFCCAMYLLMRYKKSVFETNDQILINNFRRFKRNWLNEFGTERIEILLPALILPINLQKFLDPKSKYRYRVPTKVLKYYYKHSPNYYDYYFLEALRNHLYLAKKLIDQIKVSYEKGILPFNSQLTKTHESQIKFAIIHNMFCEMNQIEKKLI